VDLSAFTDASRQEARMSSTDAFTIPLQRICSWCRIELAPGRQPATHGICPRCYVQLEELDKKHVKRVDDLPRGYRSVARRLGDQIAALRVRALREVHAALRRGGLKRPRRCVRCRSRRQVHPHHNDPATPLAVQWLCFQCLGEIRRAIILEYEIPPAVATKAKREGISLRALILKLLTEWSDKV
jgi:hypothetical protein